MCKVSLVFHLFKVLPLFLSLRDGKKYRGGGVLAPSEEGAALGHEFEPRFQCRDYLMIFTKNYLG